jgi:nucleoside-diphosphate-sugar epimerase
MPQDDLGTILVTSGTDYLGSHLVETLLADHAFSTVVSTILPQVTSNRSVPGAVYHNCDVSDAKQFTELLDTVKARVVVYTIGPGFFSPPDVHCRVTCRLSKQLVAIDRKHSGVQALVYTSSVEAIDIWMCKCGMRWTGASRMAFEYMKTGYWFNIGKARDVLGHEPVFGTEEGVRRSVGWFSEEKGWE